MEIRMNFLDLNKCLFAQNSLCSFFLQNFAWMRIQPYYSQLNYCHQFKLVFSLLIRGQFFEGHKQVWMQLFFCTFLQCRQEVFEFWLKNCKSRGYQIYFAEKEIKLSLFLSVFVAPLQGLIFDIVFAGTIYICLKLKTLFSMQQANVFDVNFRQIIEIKMFFRN
eukprot:TRINITY_DN3003_c0_g1_i16.p2 TRINITY_DN3003_c0_g1~~TRINITY_DN3003_c0_g1_i16.p2  ORF type:complete len:164 (-),score=3.54 TRINITY_DN3003_c0_g1_i16:394-885(-)